MMSRESLKQYAVAALVSLVIFFTLSFYLFLRRGYYDLYIANKAVSGAALVVLGIVLLIGPFSRLYQRFDSWILYRKELGIVAFFLALIHGIISFFWQPTKFSFNYFVTKQPLTFFLGLASLFILVFLFIISVKKLMEKVEHTRWWRWQYRGVRIAGLLAFGHVMLMKYPGWVKWVTQGGGEELARPFLPPASLIPVLFSLYVIVVRLSELLGVKIAKIISILALPLFLTTFSGLLVWGKQKTPQALPLSWETCQKLPGSRNLLAYPGICIAPDGRQAFE